MSTSSFEENKAAPPAAQPSEERALELEALNSIYPDNFKRCEAVNRPTVYSFQTKSDNGAALAEAVFSLPRGYPETRPCAVSATTWSATRVVAETAEAFETRLRTLASETEAGQPALFDLCSETDEWTSQAPTKDTGVMNWKLLVGATTEFQYMGGLALQAKLAIDAFAKEHGVTKECAKRRLVNNLWGRKEQGRLRVANKKPSTLSAVQPGRAAESKPANPTCPVCFDDFDPEEAEGGFVWHNGGCAVCSTCLLGTIRASLDQGRFLFRCPCCPEEDLPEDLVSLVLGPSDREKYWRLVANNFGDLKNHRFCPRGCGNVLLDETKTPELTPCQTCHELICVGCDLLSHWPLTCNEWALEMKANEGAEFNWEDHARHNLGLEEGQVMNMVQVELDGQNCPKCLTFWNRTHGCSHMTCVRCGTHFCYKCGKDVSKLGSYYCPCEGVEQKTFTVNVHRDNQEFRDRVGMSSKEFQEERKRLAREAKALVHHMRKWAHRHRHAAGFLIRSALRNPDKVQRRLRRQCKARSNKDIFSQKFTLRLIKTLIVGHWVMCGAMRWARLKIRKDTELRPLREFEETLAQLDKLFLGDGKVDLVISIPLAVDRVAIHTMKFQRRVQEERDEPKREAEATAKREAEEARLAKRQEGIEREENRALARQLEESYEVFDKKGRRRGRRR